MAALLLCLSLLCLWNGGAPAGDAYVDALVQSDFLASELGRNVYLMDYPQPESTVVERALSINRNATVTIGGDFRTSYIYSRANSVRPVDPNNPQDPITTPGRIGKSRLGDLSVVRARLFLDVELHQRWRARLEMDLQDQEHPHRIQRWQNDNGTYDDIDADHDILRVAYIEMMKAGHSGFGFKAGRFELPFGLSDTGADLIPESFMGAPDLTGSYLMSPDNWMHGLRMPHASKLLE
ncbi:MAG: hypothetical protein LIP23_07100, partial [Planctomycetes bacterium]|nr:hypothetical protein [Planctomycetota bacterium]